MNVVYIVAGLMTLGLLGAFLLPAGYRAAYALSLGLSVLYSVPPFRLKAVPGADWVINMWGFGTLTPYAGWAATGVSLDQIHGLVLLAFVVLLSGCALHQECSDRTCVSGRLAE